ncbi:hypothetical protein, partial [Pseudomonas sp. 2822-15]|uniref:hypothetical protein n=1 Tax=Pseudomonas sp. 2822-15 TaxID=1712677 RepID=UPI001C472026
VDKEKIVIPHNSDLVQIPNPFKEESNFILVTVEYEMVIPFPFFEIKHEIQKTSYERVWLGS